MANYKTSWVQRLIEGAWQKTFAFAHAKTVYTDYANKKTLADKLSEIDTEIGNKANKTEIPTELPANGGNSATVNGHTVNADVPENAVFTDTIYDDTEVQKRISDNGYGEVAGGKNLANFSKLGMKTHNGITFEYQQNGSIKVSGTVSKYDSVYTPLKLTKTRLSKGHWYTSSIKSSNPKSIAKLFFTDNGSSTTLQMQETADMYYYIQFFDNVEGKIPAGTVIDEVLYPQIEEGKVVTEYEPYFPSNKMLEEEKAPKANPVFTGSISLGRRDADVGENSTAEGSNTSASGKHSHAEGWHTTASGKASHAEGWNTESLDCQHAGGHFNNTTTATASKITGTGTGTSFVIGNGTSSSRSNAFRVDDNGTPYSKAGLNTTGADYAEFFEWEDGNENNEDRRGYFVTLDGKHIKIANEGDWILGIVSGFPAIIGNGDEEWKGRYVFDDFGCPVIEEFEYEDEEYETITNDDGEEEVITKKVKRTGTKWKEVPEYDPTQHYTGRMQRKEWAAIGMLGVLSVRDDGSCRVNGFCKLADGGIATASDTGYRVVKRVTDNIVEVIFK